jgi:hypothetical protein
MHAPNALFVVTGITLALAPAAILAQQRTVILSTTTST